MSSYAVQNVVASVVLIAVVALLVHLIRRIHRTRSARVGEEIRVELPPALVEPRVASVLGAVPNGRILAVAPWHLAVVVKRTPNWAMFLGIIGVLLVKEEVRLDVVLFGHDGGTVVRMTGSTEHTVLEALRDELGAPTRA